MFIATIPSVLYVDKVSRTSAGWAAIVTVWLFVVFSGFSWGPCAWIIIAGVWPLSNRPYGLSLGASSNWMNNFIIRTITPDMLTSITYGTYILFGLLTYLGAAFIFFYVPETKRLTLEEMDVVFGSEGTVQADFERMEEINKEIGLDQMLKAQDNRAEAGIVDDEKRVEAEHAEITT
jgi:hypothetical protein